MKVFTTLTILATVGLCFVYGDIVISQEHKDGLLKVSKACVAETGASDADIAELLADTPASTKNGKCYKACLMKVFKTMDGSGKLDKGVFIGFLKTVAVNDAEYVENGEKITDVCLGIDVPSDNCEAADLYFTCLYKDTKLSGFNAKFV